ncbi:MAG: hypothetical protein A2W99_00075 [Bacteroidetes bacterium GWF2_33_16]|nr:MAG: hypothetical protein A2X00_02780 [Bacteroidetes bacterium GWE2_32_14]OFY08672.1 MAG: hypothetical protein A2W99_00075 [Bacteroidetes bacterium GWF2_33_16]
MNHVNKKTRITASAIGVLLGLSGALNHGIFEILQGNILTNGFFIEAISEKHRLWLYGSEAAFTIVHNFLITGILAVLTGLAIVFWSLKYLHSKHGATVFLSLLILLTLVGGGIGYIVLFIPTWAFATLINKPLNWWNKTLSDSIKKRLSGIWIYCLVATVLSWLWVMQLGIFGYFPGQSNPDIIMGIVLVFLFLTVVLACFTFICSIARDIEEHK